MANKAEIFLRSMKALEAIAHNLKKIAEEFDGLEEGELRDVS